MSWIVIGMKIDGFTLHQRERHLQAATTTMAARRSSSSFIEPGGKTVKTFIRYKTRIVPNIRVTTGGPASFSGSHNG